MASQPDSPHKAENASHHSLLGLDFSPVDIPDVTGDPLLQTGYGYVDRNEFENAPGPAPPWEQLDLPTPDAAAGCIDPRLLLHEQPSDQAPSPASELGDPPRVTTIADDAFAFTERQITVGSTHWQQSREIGIPEVLPEATPQNEQSKGIRKCLKCRYEKKKCEHPTRYDAELLPTILAAYSMLFIAPDFLMRRIHALYANVVALGSSFQGHLRSDDNPVSLHMVLEGHSPSAGLRNEHEVVFLSDWLRFMLQTDTHTHSTVMDPAIYVIGFDDFISRKMWPGHEQQPGTKFTLAQEITLQTARLFCGYVTLLANLDHIEIYTEYTEHHTARLIGIALVCLFSHRLCQLYQDLGRNLQALVDKKDSNHYFAARTLELIYTCLRVSTPFDWATTNYPISRQLDRIRLLLNERIPIIWQDIQNIERDFASPTRGDKRLKQDPTMQAADKLRFKNLQIYFGRDRLSQLSTNMMLTRNGSRNMYSIPDLLSSQPSRDADQPDPPSVNPGLPLAYGDGTFTTQVLLASGSHVHDGQLPSRSARTNAATRPSAATDSDPVNNLSPSGLTTWSLGADNKDWWLEGGTSNEFP